MGTCRVGLLGWVRLLGRPKGKGGGRFLGLSAADRAEEKGGERSGPQEEGVWAGQKRGLGREIEFWAGLGFLFPILSSFLFAISNTTQSKNHLNSNSNLNSNLALKQKNNAPA